MGEVMSKLTVADDDDRPQRDPLAGGAKSYSGIGRYWLNSLAHLETNTNPDEVPLKPSECEEARPIDKESSEDFVGNDELKLSLSCRYHEYRHDDGSVTIVSVDGEFNVTFGFNQLPFGIGAWLSPFDGYADVVEVQQDGESMYEVRITERSDKHYNPAPTKFGPYPRKLAEAVATRINKFSTGG